MDPCVQYCSGNPKTCSKNANTYKQVNMTTMTGEKADDGDMAATNEIRYSL